MKIIARRFNNCISLTDELGNVELVNIKPIFSLYRRADKVANKMVRVTKIIGRLNREYS